MIGNSLRWELNAFVGFIERQKNLYRRYWLWEAVWLLYNLVSVLSIGYLAAGLSTLGLEPGQASLHQTQLYLLVGALLWTYLSLVFFEIAFAITWERWEGTIEYTFMAPIKRLTHLLGMSAASLIYGIARTAAIGFALIFFFNLDLSHANWLTALAIFAAATLPLLGLGIFTSVLRRHALAVDLHPEWGTGIAAPRALAGRRPARCRHPAADGGDPRAGLRVVLQPRRSPGETAGATEAERID